MEHMEEVRPGSAGREAALGYVRREASQVCMLLKRAREQRSCPLLQVFEFSDYCVDLFGRVCGADTATQEAATTRCGRRQHHVDVNTGLK